MTIADMIDERLQERRQFLKTLQKDFETHVKEMSTWTAGTCVMNDVALSFLASEIAYLELMLRHIEREK